MAKSKIFFIELTFDNKFRHTCDIIENLYEKNISTTIFVKDNKNAAILDKQLWTWKQESFIPHIIINESINQPEEPIIITTNASIPPITDALLFFDPMQSVPLDKYIYIIDFAEIYNRDKVQNSRVRFKEIRDKQGYNPEFYKFGAFLKNFTV